MSSMCGQSLYDALVNMITPDQAAQQAEALARVRAARIKRDKAIDDLNQEIRAALSIGCRPADVAVAAGLSRQRISQIRREA